MYHPDVVVDTFFTISGFVTAYAIFKVFEITGTLQPWNTIFRRYMRYPHLIFTYLFIYDFIKQNNAIACLRAILSCYFIQLNWIGTTMETLYYNP